MQRDYDQSAGIETDQRLAKIEENEPELATATFRFLSRNAIHLQQNATEEEHLHDIVNELRDELIKDMGCKKTNSRGELSSLYPNFMEKAKKLVEDFKESSSSRGARRLCSVPSFALALTMVSSVWRHYTHSSWFKIAELNTMLETHGAVSKIVYLIDRD